MGNATRWPEAKLAQHIRATIAPPIRKRMFRAWILRTDACHHGVLNGASSISGEEFKVKIGFINAESRNAGAPTAAPPPRSVNKRDQRKMLVARNCPTATCDEHFKTSGEELFEDAVTAGQPRRFANNLVTQVGSMSVRYWDT